jgi:acyl-CoA thioesterase I
MVRSIGFRCSLMPALATALLLAGSHIAQAQVVAFGASNVQGHGVRPSEAYPAQLEAMLRARGVKVRVKNAGIYGDTSAHMLARLDSAIPGGTRVVILDSSGEFLNDYVHGVSRQQGQANLAQMVSRLQGRGITVIQESTQDLPMSERQADRTHLTPEGHRVVAARLVDQVARALGH